MADRPPLLLLWYLLVAAIIVVSLLPASVFPSASPASDTPLHFVTYLGLTLIRLLTLPLGRRAFQAILFCGGLGLVLELLQSFIPGRGFEWDDLAANFVGIAAGTLTSFFIRFRKRTP